MKRSLLLTVLFVAPQLAWCGPSAAQTEKARPAKDPVESAFALPRHVQLTADQREAYQQMRQRLEPELRAALDRVASAPDEQARRSASRDVARIRQRIQRERANIVAQGGSPAKGGVAAGPQAGRAAGWHWNWGSPVYGGYNPYSPWYGGAPWYPYPGYATYWGPVYVPVWPTYGWDVPVLSVPTTPAPVTPTPTVPAGPPAWRQVQPPPQPWQNVTRPVQPWQYVKPP